ncbi:MAG: MFS transporter [Corynebacterium sp.]|nr:MFS transporter [Corynebacterium sp.]
MITTTQQQVQHRWFFLLVISLGLFMVSADNSILYTALPELREQLSASDTQALWIINAYPLILAGLLLGTGTLGDKIGHRRMFELGLILFAVASLAAALSPDANYLIAARALLGVGAATMMPATLALIRLTFHDVQERNTAIGIWGSVAAVGAAVGPVLGGWLLEHFYWGSVFLINIPVAIFALLVTFRLAPPNIANPHKQWDLLSSVLAMFTMLGAVMVIKQLANEGNIGVIVGAAVLALSTGTLFAVRQRKLDEPLLTFDVFRNRIFSAGAIAAVAAMFILAGTEMLTTQRFQLAHDFSPLQAGLVTAAIALAALPASIAGGANLHRWGFLPIISGGFSLIAVGLAVAWWGATDGDSFAIIITGLVLSGLGAGFAFSVASTAIIGSAPKHRAGMASSIEEVSFEFGTLISVAILGSLFPRFYSNHAPAEIVDSYDAALHQEEWVSAAQSAIDSAYGDVLVVVTAVAIVAAIATAILLRGNPKETEYAHE